ncbi:MAG: hypothetical protein DDT35_00651 [Firmicutes bacterium]|nr:hypothetical protein [Bacillota bacterium]
MKRSFLFDNMVVLLFVAITGLGIWFSGLSLGFVVMDLVTRIARNGLIVVALLIPVTAGMGLNFAVILGAMAAQIAIIAVVHWQIAGINGILLATLLSTPLAILFGLFIGRLLNKTRGQEMITSMIAGFFADGLYMLLLMVIVGTLIPLRNPQIMLPHGIGILNTVDLAILRGAVDDLYRMSFPHFMVLVAAIFLSIGAWFQYSTRGSRQPSAKRALPFFLIAGAAALSFVLTRSPDSSFVIVSVPVVTFAIIGLACAFLGFIATTKLGQDFRTVGQDQHVAKISGIDVDKTRIIAITISTVMAAWGQILLLSNLGNLSTYGSHISVGVFAIAALLIGGATVTKATVGQALTGLVLFHTLFLVSPMAGRNLLGDAQLGEFFRVFIAYGVIAVSLAMYAWKRAYAGKRQLRS